MRKIQLSIFSFLMAVAANAQKGTVLVGGNTSFSTLKNQHVFINDQFYSISRSTNFAINPFVGYQFDKNWTAGVTGSLDWTKEKYVSPMNYAGRHTSYGFGPFVRYTHQLSDIFSLFGQLEGQYKRTDGSDLRGVSSKLFPAVFINVKNGFGLNLDFGGIEYEMSSYKHAPANLRSGQFGVNFGKTFNIGISKNF
ncbi:outer membrane beta-barrel protein [Niabella insulamsoli]|uniref:outer membrane beta-barrel protein n=1 Tax=Niabella insulamsoli TaxID=3144874 RepID=UPI0031FE310C